jgi:hypothetical protein
MAVSQAPNPDELPGEYLLLMRHGSSKDREAFERQIEAVAGSLTTYVKEAACVAPLRLNLSECRHAGSSDARDTAEALRLKLVSNGTELRLVSTATLDDDPLVLLRQFLSNTLKSRGFLTHYAFP